jgi:O-antigen ligase
VWRHRDGQWRDATSSFLALAGVLVILASKNRDAVLLFPLALGLFAMLWSYGRPGLRRRPLSTRFKVSMALAALALFLGLLLVIEQVSVRRILEGTHRVVPFGHATLALIDLDPRPSMWAEYLRLGLSHPVEGVGFGRTLPAIVYDVANDPAMIADHANRFEHAHNLFINTWLQQGAIGLCLLLAALIGLFRHAISALKAEPRRALGGVAVVTLLVTSLLRNSLDDFLVYSMASAFWIALGLLLAIASGEAGEATSSLRMQPPP